MALRTYEIYGVPVTCTDNGAHGWVHGKFKIELDYNSTRTAYTVKVYGGIYVTDRMNWGGTVVLKATCNGKTSDAEVYMEMRNTVSGSGNDTDWFGPASFEFGAPGDTTLNFSLLKIDLSKVPGENGQWGIYHVSGGGNMTGFSNYNYGIDVTAIPLGKKPDLTSIVNNNKYNNPILGIQDYVSADMVTIDIKCNVKDWGIPTAKIYWSCSDGQSSNTSSDTFRISNLKPGISYKIDVYMKNDIGSSETRSITIRTRYEPPVVDLELEDVDLEQLIFHWVSDKELAVTEYKIDDSEWVELGQTGLEGSFTAQWFDPKTTHTIYFRGISTPELDYLNSNETDASGTTHDRAHIVAIGEKIFGLPIDITIESESDKLLKMDIWTNGNNLEPHFIYDGIKAGDQIWTFNPTQDQLDQMYRTYPKTNEVPIHFLLTTHGEWKDWNDDQKDEILTLTGIAKTAHVGDSSNKPRRCQVWIGDEDNKPRRSVVWVGVNGESHRTI